jgi:hypothetical protein
MQETAAKFTAMTSGNLATVHLGLTNHSGLNRKSGGAVNVFLCRDAWGRPSATQTYLGTVAPTAWWGDKSNNSVVSLRVAGRAQVFQGLDYWLVLKPVALETLLVPDMHLYMADIWNKSLPAVSGSTLYSPDGGVTWLTITESDDRLPAFGITAWPRPVAESFRVQPGGLYHP